MTPNLSAFLAVIRACEGTAGPNGYHTLFGGSLFEGYADHPRTAITASGYTSTAAGAYQILAGTWNDFIAANGPHDFSPDNQDLCARWLIDRRHATAAVESGDLERAIALCGKEWASLPGSPYGQPTRSLEYCRAIYAAHGGTGTVTQPSNPKPLPRNPTPLPRDPIQLPPGQPLRKPMDSTKNVFGAIIAQLIPQAAKILLAGSPYGALADTVIQTVVQATGAVNEQQAVEKMSDPVTGPEMVKVATQAVVTQPDVMAVLEVGGGIQAARAADVVATQADRPFWFSPAFHISVLLLAMPFMLLADLFYVHPTSYEGNLRTQIVTGVLLIISVVGGYFLGSSAGSAKKDETIARTAK